MTSADVRARSFGAIAGSYDRLRPSPPADAVDWLLPRRCDVVVDLAAGTGILTRSLLGRTGEIIAVEPDERMRAILVGRTPGVRVLDGTGEHIPLPSETADAVLVSSAWHWMDPARAVREIARVLRPGGRFGLIWTSPRRDVPWLRDLRRSEPDREPDGGSPHRHREPADLFGLFDPGEQASFGYTRSMRADDVVALQGTYSRTITLDTADRTARLKAARTILSGYFPDQDVIDVPIVSRCWRSNKSRPGRKR